MKLNWIKCDISLCGNGPWWAVPVDTNRRDADICSADLNKEIIYGS